MTAVLRWQILRPHLDPQRRPLPAFNSPVPPPSSAPATVLLFHGLGRSARSMAPLARRIARAGFETVNVDYPSTCHAIETLAAVHVRPVVERAAARGPVHFVTHSLGGILVRVLAERDGLPEGTRAVMLAPPNGGSEIADALGDRWPFTRFCGPSLTELGTDGACVPPRLGPVRVEVGVIAGDRNLYPWFAPLFGGPNDGLVAVERTKVEGMADFAVVHAGHALIMRNRTVAEQTIHFLRHGRFRNDTAG